jgi:two-component system KDP operon response regulator KdpE
VSHPVFRLLVVDDDPAILEMLVASLSGAGYDVCTASSGSEALGVFRSSRPDLVLTDLAMPRGDGFELIASVRASDGTPVIVISVRGADVDKIRALDLGADDFVTKPFSVPELLARVRAQLRRKGPPGPAVLTFPGLTIDRERRRVVQAGREVRLTPTEFALLEALSTNAGKPVTTARLIGQVWKGSSATTAETVRVHMASLRRKLEPDPAQPRYIVTEPWVGYRFLEEPLD